MCLQHIRFPMKGNNHMKFEYTFRSTALDYMKFYLGNTYHSMMAAVNIIFTCAMIALTYAKFTQTNLLGKILLILAICIFPVFQPLAVYVRSRKDAAKVNKVDTWVGFDDAGMHIRVEQHQQLIRWRDIYPAVVRKTMVICAPDGVHAYLLANRVLGDTRDAFIAYHDENVQKYSRYKDEK